MVEYKGTATMFVFLTVNITENLLPGMFMYPLQWSFGLKSDGEDVGTSKAEDFFNNELITNVW